MRKPASAFAFEKKARENLERKLAALKTLLEKGALPPQIPTSLRRFNAWKSAGAEPCMSFERNANETLARHPELRDAAVALMHRAKEVSKPVVRPKEVGVRRAREQARLHLTIRQIAEAELIRTRADNIQLRREVDALRAQIESMSEEATRIREHFEAELEKVRAQHAELLRTRPTNIRAIRPR